MAETEDRRNATSVQHQSGTENAPCAVPSVLSRPRLGAGYDSWSTVFKDMLREAPKTGLVILATIAVAVINSITCLWVEFVASSAASPLNGGLPTCWLLAAVIEVLSR
jgi:hypothetical protein